MRLLTQSGFYLIGRVGPAAIGVCGIAIYTRLLDPASIGTYAILLSTSLLASGIGFTWLRIAALRVAAGEKKLETDFTTTVGLLFVGTAIVVAVIEGVALHFYQRGFSVDLIVLAAAAAISAAWYDLNASLLQARLKVVYWGLLNLARAVVAVTCSVVLIYAGFREEALLGGFVFGNASTLAFMKMWRPAVTGRFDAALFWRCFHFGWPQSVNAAQALIAPTFQRWTLQLIAGSGAVGIFAVSQDFSTQTIASIVGAISLAGIPLAYREKERGDVAALNAQLRENAGLIFAIALPATVGFAILSSPIAHSLFGMRFWSGASLILTLVGVSAFAVNLRTYYFDQAFELAMETRPQAAISVIGTVLAVAATLILVPRFAAVGAAVGGLLASIVCLVLSIVWGMRILRMPLPIRDWSRTAIATIGMGLVLVLVPKENNLLGLFFAISGGTIVYIVLSSAMRFSLLRTHFGGRFVWLQR
jgi:O-antigen/teichoic acid export membrane protein